MEDLVGLGRARTTYNHSVVGLAACRPAGNPVPLCLARQLAFGLETNGGGTTSTLVHRFDDRYGAASFATGWGRCLEALRALLVGQPPPPADRGVARHEALVREFGIDEPEVPWSGERWALRVERQLTCPAEVAEPRVLALDVAPGGGPGNHVRLDLGEGTGHGARLVLTVSGTGRAELEAAADEWGGGVGHLAAPGAEWASAQPGAT